MPSQRLDKLLASTGRWSRREVKHLIKEGRVLLNGTPAGAPEEKADPNTDSILVDGADLGWQAFTYVMMCKPAGVLSATEDRRQKTVLDLLPEELQRKNLFLTGRLDKDTEGLLLLTNDGALAHRLMLPRNHVEKTYYAKLDLPLTEEDCADFAQGITLADGSVCRPAKLELLNDGTEVFITIHEGKFHQIKRMVSTRGAAVRYLKRLSLGPLHLDEGMQPGEYRLLTPEEVAEIGGNP